jgi:hypothetical protein
MLFLFLLFCFIAISGCKSKGENMEDNSRCIKYSCPVCLGKGSEKTGICGTCGMDLQANKYNK